MPETHRFSGIEGARRIRGDGDTFCVLTMAGQVACWGDNAGEPYTDSNGTLNCRPRMTEHPFCRWAKPVAVPLLWGSTESSLGFGGLALTPKGEVRSWRGDFSGANSGAEGRTPYAAQVEADLARSSRVFSGWSARCGLTLDRRLRCVVGDDTSAVDISGGDDVVDVDDGYEAMCVARSDGGIACSRAGQVALSDAIQF